MSRTAPNGWMVTIAHTDAAHNPHYHSMYGCEMYRTNTACDAIVERAQHTHTHAHFKEAQIRNESTESRLTEYWAVIVIKMRLRVRAVT